MKEKGFNLDHFYTSFPQEEFNSLKQLVGVFRNVLHLQLNNGKISYEGIYIMTQNGHYIELLVQNENFENKKIQNIVVNTFNSPLGQLGKVQALTGENWWKRTEKPTKITESVATNKSGFYDRQDIGKDWFYSWTRNEQESEEEKEEAKTAIWIIDYADNKFNRAWNNKKLLLKDYDFKQVRKINWNMKSDEYEIMKREGKWAAQSCTEEGDKLVLLFNNPNGKNVEFQITKDENRKVGIETITFEKMNKDQHFNQKNDSYVSIVDKKEEITFEFKEF